MRKDVKITVRNKKRKELLKKKLPNKYKRYISYYDRSNLDSTLFATFGFIPNTSTMICPPCPVCEPCICPGVNIDPNNASDHIIILSLDGGGIRGLFQTELLMHIVNNLKFSVINQDLLPSDNELYKWFTLIAGTSIGGIQSLALASGITLETMKHIFVQQGRTIFPEQSQVTKYAKTVTGYPWYSNEPLRDVLDNRGFGGLMHLDIPGKFIVPAYNLSSGEATFFTNAGIFGIFDAMKVTPNLPITDIALATAAAPIYFDEYSIEGQEYLDGGLYANNPSLLLYCVARKLYPGKMIHMLSLGTGVGKNGFRAEFQNQDYETDFSAMNVVGNTFETTNFSDTVDIGSYKAFNNAVSGAVSGSSDLTVFCMNVLEDSGTQNLNYLRLNFNLDDETYDPGLDNASPENLLYLINMAGEVFNNNLDKIIEWKSKIPLEDKIAKGL